MSTFIVKIVKNIGNKNLLKQISYRSSLYSTYNKTDIDALVKNNKVVVFMKGVPDEPKCGFSNAVVQILRMHGVKYDAHDVLTDDELRQGIKTFSNWPTIPQIFISGEFVGGCDILLQMHQNGELVEELRKAGVKSALLDKAMQEEENKKSGEAK